MRIILASLFVLLMTWKSQGQVLTYTFECVCGELTGANCDICTGTVTGRIFNGLLIRKNGVAHKWIDEPYTVRVVSNNVLQFVELIPNPESININFANTQYSTFQGFKDSTNCFCSAPVAEPRMDTLFVVENPDLEAEIQSTAPWQLPIIIKTKGDGISIAIDGSDNGGSVQFENTAPDQEVVLDAGAGINIASAYPNFTITNTGDLSITNEGIVGVMVDTDSTSILHSNTFGAYGVTFKAGEGLAVTDIPGINNGGGIFGGNGGEIRFRNTGDLSSTNELQTISTASNTVTLSNSGGSFTIAGAGTNTVSTTGNTITVTGAADGDGSSTNELQNLTLSGQALGITGGTGVTLPLIGASAGTGIGVSTSGGVATITNTGDLSVTNEGVLGVSAGIETTSILTSNTTGANGVTLAVGGGLSIAETTSANGGTITITNAAPDQTVVLNAGTGIGVSGSYPNFTVTNTGDLSATNELQTISTSGAAGNITLSNGGGTLNLNVNDADASSTNEVLTITDGTNTEALGGQTLLVAATGTVSASYNTATNTLTISGTNTNTDAQNLTLAGQALGITGGTGVTLPIVDVSAGTGIGVSTSGGVATITNTGDLSATNELQTISTASNTVTLSNSGGSFTIAGAGTNTVSTTGNTITVTGAADGDGNSANEGLLGVGAGSATTAQITSNTTGANPIIFSAASGIGITELTGSNGGTIAIENTAPDQTVVLNAGTGVGVSGSYPNFTVTNTGDLSATNELQTISTASNTVTLSNSGGSFTIAGAGTNTVSTAGNTITVTGAADGDGSSTNELQTITRNSDNTVTLSNSGGTVSVEEVRDFEKFTPTSGTTITLTKTIPADVSKFTFERGGLVQTYGTGESVVSINTTTKVVTVTRAFVAGETFIVRFPKQ